MIQKISNKYSLFDKIGLAFTVMRTKLICVNARIIRSGSVIRGRAMIDFGHGLTTGYNCRIEALSTGKDDCAKIKFGNKVQLNDNVHIAALESISIGDNVLIASHVYISDNSHGSYKGFSDDTPPTIPPISRPYFVAPVTIGSNVWIGEGVMIMPGVTIGAGSIVGAHSLVNRDIPSNTIAVGSPVKIIKKWNQGNKRWEKIT